MTSVASPGLRVAFLSGTYSASEYGSVYSDRGRFVDTNYTADAIDKVKHFAWKNCSGDIDVLLTSEWPSRFWSTSKQQEWATPVDKEHSSPAVWDLFVALKPRYHIYGGAERYMFRKSPQGQHDFICTSLALTNPIASPEQWFQVLPISTRHASPRMSVDGQSEAQGSVPTSVPVAPSHPPLDPTANATRTSERMQKTNLKMKREPCSNDVQVRDPATTTSRESSPHSPRDSWDVGRPARSDRISRGRSPTRNRASDAGKHKRSENTPRPDLGRSSRPAPRDRSADVDKIGRQRKKPRLKPEVSDPQDDAILANANGLVVFEQSPDSASEDRQDTPENGRRLLGLDRDDDETSVASDLSLPTPVGTGKPLGNAAGSEAVTAGRQASQPDSQTDAARPPLRTPPVASKAPLTPAVAAPAQDSWRRGLPLARCAVAAVAVAGAADAARPRAPITPAPESIRLELENAMANVSEPQSVRAQADKAATPTPPSAVTRPELAPPAGWQVMWSSTKQRTYYLHTASGESTWKMPKV